MQGPAQIPQEEAARGSSEQELGACGRRGMKGSSETLSLGGFGFVKGSQGWRRWLGVLYMETKEACTWKVFPAGGSGVPVLAECCVSQCPGSVVLYSAPARTVFRCFLEV